MVEVNGNKIRFSCQFCAAKLNSNLKKAGTQDHCPECHRPFVTPGAEILKKRKAERLQIKEAETLRQAEVERLRAAARAKRNEQVSGIKEKAKSASKLATLDRIITGALPIRKCVSSIEERAFR